MNSLTLLNDLFRQMAWADALAWRSVFASEAARDDKQLRGRLHHIHLCQHAWLKIWKGEPVDANAGEGFDVRQLAAWARQYHDAAAQYLEGLSESDLGERVIVPQTGEDFRQPHLWESFVQITTHSTYHRGQVSARIREIGGEPAQTDFVLWVGLGKPNADWPENL
ncbi:MAG: DinB family protein [Acidobacteria bacterium OLB17]|nr:MAG: DinB family protein [Acidobacteria bacterium OLB17]MCZ2390756.1 DinB family protein [Acidobacteriota bacterium]